MVLILSKNFIRTLKQFDFISSDFIRFLTTKTEFLFRRHS